MTVVQAEPRPVFQVLVVYEDFAAGRQANETCSFLLSQLGDEFELRCGMWKFEMLRNPKLAEIAAAEALEADAIIVAVHDSSPLPVDVTNWIEHWLPLRDDRTTALIALISSHGGTIGTASPVYTYLEKIAAAANMDFLPHILGFKIEQRASRFPSEDASMQLDQLMSRPVPERHWGINE